MKPNFPDEGIGLGSDYTALGVQVLPGKVAVAVGNIVVDTASGSDFGTALETVVAAAEGETVVGAEV